MKRFLKALLICLLYGLNLYAEVSNQLSSYIQSHTEAGDYYVFYNQKTYTLFIVLDKGPDTLTFDEISIAKTRFTPLGLSWERWIEKEYPGHQSWVRTAIKWPYELVQVTDMDQNLELDPMGERHYFFQTLIQIPLEELSSKEKGDWSPPIPMDPPTTFILKKAIWPQDRSKLSERRLFMYFSENRDPWPNALPYWIENRDSFNKYILRLVYAGRITHDELEQLRNF